MASDDKKTMYPHGVCPLYSASLPYQWEHDNRNEHYYHALLYTLLTSFGADVRAEESTARGYSDLTLQFMYYPIV